MGRKSYYLDRVGPQGLRFFQEIVEADRLLVDPERRRPYAQGLFHAEPGVRMSEVPLRGLGVHHCCLRLHLRVSP
ncbi:MAG TPA: hypothetical protein VGX03_02285 [Candidatus Binatia bacterium]|nr:hypothetical protein [Candidatus Binatia bacterium]